VSFVLAAVGDGMEHGRCAYWETCEHETTGSPRDLCRPKEGRRTRLAPCEPQGTARHRSEVKHSQQSTWAA